MANFLLFHLQERCTRTAVDFSVVLNFLTFKNIYFVCVCVYVYSHVHSRVIVDMQRSEDNLKRLILSFHNVPRLGTERVHPGATCQLAFVLLPSLT